MQTRVRPKDSILASWIVETYDPYEGVWIKTSEHKTFFFANFVAKRLSKRNLSVKMNEHDKKDEFLGRLAGKNVIGIPGPMGPTGPTGPPGQDGKCMCDSCTNMSPWPDSGL